MRKLAQNISVAIVFAVAADLLTAQPASAISAGLARKCRESAIKAHPTPKAGSKTNATNKAQRDYFQACIAKEDKSKE